MGFVIHISIIIVLEKWRLMGRKEHEELGNVSGAPFPGQKQMTKFQRGIFPHLEAVGKKSSGCLLHVYLKCCDHNLLGLIGI